MPEVAGVAARPLLCFDAPQRRATGEYAAPVWKASPARWAVAFPWAYAPGGWAGRALYHRGQRRYDRVFCLLLVDAGALKGWLVELDVRQLLT